MLELVLDGAVWYQVALAVGLAAIAPHLRRLPEPPARRTTVLTALNLHYGCVMVMMAAGHLIAVAIQASRDALASGSSRLFLLAVGFAMLVPAVLIVVEARRLRTSGDRARRRLLLLNGWLALLLVATITSAPLALPALLCIAILRGSSPRRERAIVAATIVTHAAMLIAAMLLTGVFS